MGFQKTFTLTFDTKDTLVYGQLLTLSVTQSDTHKLHLLPRQPSDFCILLVGPGDRERQGSSFLRASASQQGERKKELSRNTKPVALLVPQA